MPACSKDNTCLNHPKIHQQGLGTFSLGVAPMDIRYCAKSRREGGVTLKEQVSIAPLKSFCSGNTACPLIFASSQQSCLLEDYLYLDSCRERRAGVVGQVRKEVNMAKQSVMYSKCVGYNYDPTEVGLRQVIDIRTEYHKIVIISFPLPPLLNLSAFHKKFSPYIQTKTTNMSFQMRSILPPMSQPAFLSLRKSKQCRFLIAHKRAQKKKLFFLYHPVKTCRC